MTNLLNDLVYVTLQDARDTSNILDSNPPTDADLTKLLTESQWVIDCYIQSYWTRFVSTQTFLFPVIDTDESSLIPTDIKLATIQIAEYLYTSWSKNPSAIKWDKVAWEANLTRTVSYSTKTGWHINDVQTVVIPLKTLNILDKYRLMFIWQVI